MRSRFSPRVRFFSLVLAGLLLLSQTNCVSVQWSPSMAPGGEGGETTNPPGGGSGGASTGNIVGIATIAVVGGYLVYRVITGGQAEEENPSASMASPDPESGRPLPTPITRDSILLGENPVGEGP